MEPITDTLYRQLIRTLTASLLEDLQYTMSWSVHKHVDQLIGEPLKILNAAYNIENR